MARRAKVGRESSRFSLATLAGHPRSARSITNGRPGRRRARTRGPRDDPVSMRRSYGWDLSRPVIVSSCRSRTPTLETLQPATGHLQQFPEHRRSTSRYDHVEICLRGFLAVPASMSTGYPDRPTSPAVTDIQCRCRPARRIYWEPPQPTPSHKTEWALPVRSHDGRWPHYRNLIGLEAPQRPTPATTSKPRLPTHHGIRQPVKRHVHHH